jgi:hypothetical protein
VSPRKFILPLQTEPLADLFFFGETDATPTGVRTPRCGRTGRTDRQTDRDAWMPNRCRQGEGGHEHAGQTPRVARSACRGVQGRQRRQTECEWALRGRTHNAQQERGPRLGGLACFLFLLCLASSSRPALSPAKLVRYLLLPSRSILQCQG